MARTIQIHRASIVKFAPIDELVGAAAIKAFTQPGDNGGEPAEIPLSGLAFIDVDGEINVYVMADEEKQVVIQQLTGGLVLPG